MTASKRTPETELLRSGPQGGPSPRQRYAVLFIGLLAASGAAVPALNAGLSPQAWLASVDLTLRDANGKPLPDALGGSARALSGERALGRAVDLVQLDRDPEFNGGETTPLSVAMELLSGEGGEGIDARHRAIRTLGRQIAVEWKPGSPEARLLVRASSREKAMKIAEAMAMVYIAATETTGSVPDDSALKALEQAEAALAEFRSASGPEKLSQALVLRSRIKGLDNHRAEVAAEPDPAEALKNATLKDVLDGRAGTEGADGPLSSLRRAYAEAEMQVAKLSVSLGPKHPTLLAARADLAKARAAVEARLLTVKKSGGDEAQRRTKLLDALDGQQADLRAKLTATGIDLARYDTLVMALDSARTRLRDPGVPADATSHPIHEASVPKEVAAPQAGGLWFRMLLGGLAGLGAALAFVLARRPGSGPAQNLPTVAEPGAGKREPALEALPKEQMAAVSAAAPMRAKPEQLTPAGVQRALARQHWPANGKTAPRDESRRIVLTPPPPEQPLPTIEKLRRVAPHLFEEADAAGPDVERIRQELADLRHRVLAKAGRRI
ncbi:hypothetical protein [Gellertiella hungarica]|uniref:Uncharacterized protein involved in exopolysaccharide biosynthesis n=1 Tax=Gellertiella hungarica TaxID=1572859 RepID=A0A7W6J3Q1_9HYPH|nr:hypothetical protein [Gellertiella hungarica]MBB4064152.1 uncharacterized protein involved in exopolysaccharide biosynthesis [Gellertiella hungarica]